MSAKDRINATEATAPEPLTDAELEEAAGGYGKRMYYSYSSSSSASYKASTSNDDAKS